MDDMRSPWISIWMNPRKTISAIAAGNPKKGIWVLAWIYGFLSLLNCFQSIGLGRSISLMPILFLAFFLAPLWGMAIFGVWSLVVYWVGKLLKGQGTFATVRAAYAWSCVPFIVSIGFWVILLAVFGLSLFQTSMDSQPLQTAQVALLFTILIAKVVLAVWSLVIFINGLAAVQHFSVIRSIVNIILAWIAVGFVIWMLLWGLGSMHLAEVPHISNTSFLLKLEALGI